MSPTDGGTARTPVVDRALIKKTVVGLVLLLLGSALCAFLLKDPLVALGQTFMDRFGLGGVFIGTLIADTSPLPLSHEPLVMLAIPGVERGELDWRILLLTVASASVLAGPVGWSFGRLLLAGTRFSSWIERRHPRFVGFMEEHGIKAVAVAALLPIPFALATWSAGALRLPFLQILGVSLLRIVKTSFYMGLMLTGWIAGGA